MRTDHRQFALSIEDGGTEEDSFGGHAEQEEKWVSIVDRRRSGVLSQDQQ